MKRTINIQETALGYVDCTTIINNIPNFYDGTVEVNGVKLIYSLDDMNNVMVDLEGSECNSYLELDELR